MPVRVLLAEDHRLVRDGFKALLAGSEFQVEAEASRGWEAVRLARRHQPDLALIDLMMPDLNGLEITRELLRVSPRSKVVILTMHGDDDYVSEALRAGVRGYMLKTQPAPAFLSALRDVVRGAIYVPPASCQALAEGRGRGPGRSACEQLEDGGRHCRSGRSSRVAAPWRPAV